MNRWIKRTLQALAVCAGSIAITVSLGACCQENASKTEKCKEANSTEACEECCGGNYSYMGEGNCKCY